MTLTPAVLTAAIHGLQAEISTLSEQLRTLQQIRDGSRQQQPNRRPLSTDARKRISAAQRQRWQVYYKKQAAAAAPKKRTRTTVKRATAKRTPAKRAPAKRAPSTRAPVKAISSAA